MAFASIVTLLLFYYIRPQDWVPGMSGFNVVKLAVAACMVGLLQRPRSEPRWRFMSSPQEWSLAIFFGYVIFTSPDPGQVVSDLGVLVVYALMALHTLTSEELLLRYLRWWLTAMVGILVMIIITRIGWDFTNARQLIDIMEGRLCLNTYTLNNPNALGHTLVALLPLAYYLFFWNSAAISRVWAAMLMLLGLWAIIPTKSKGAFISGGVAFMISVLFGRKLVVQLVVGLAALAMGGTILAMLPRMEQMKSIGSEEGVQGRMLAWAMARAVTMTKPTGMGFKQFHAWIRVDGVMDDKSTHSAFVMVGGDLGPIGLAIYLGMLLVCARSLVQYKGLTETMERCRRSLFALLMGLLISGWMLDRAYYTEVFCLIGAVAAYHQLSVRARREEALAELTAKREEMKEHEGQVQPYGLPLERAKASPGPVSKEADDEEFLASEIDPNAVEAETLKVPGLWTRLGLMDVVIAVVGMLLAFQFWDYVMATIKP